MKKISLLICITALLCGSGCSDRTRAQFSALGQPHMITLYAANGNIIKQWHTNGKVGSAHSSDGYEFQDKDTGRLVQVSGTVVVDTL